MLPLFYHDRPPHSRKSTRKALKLHFLSRQTGCKRSFFTPQPPGCGKGGKSTAFMRVSSPKTTTENCMDYPVWNELFTFSTGFSTVFVKKRRSFQRCFPPFPHSFPHPVGESPIQAVMDAAAFWKFVGKNVGNLPFIKKKVEGFSFVFTVSSAVCLGYAHFIFYPKLEVIITNNLGFTAIAYLCFGLLSFLPFFIELKELMQWNFCRSKI